MKDKCLIDGFKVGFETICFLIGPHVNSLYNGAFN